MENKNQTGIEKNFSSVLEKVTGCPVTRLPICKAWGNLGIERATRIVTRQKGSQHGYSEYCPDFRERIFSLEW